MTIEEIYAAVQRLTPAQRRKLMRRFAVTGLLSAADLHTDQRRLLIAPALGMSQADSPSPSPFAETGRRPAAADGDDYRSPVSGRVVRGAPGSETRAADPHAMSPLPGQAPDKPIEVIFDGGSRGNPGQGYGSYALRWPGQAERIVQLKFGHHVTNNEAEYDTLIAALEAILARLQDAGADPATAQVTMRGDSLLVISQVNGEWQCKEPRLQKRLTRTRELLRRFRLWSLIHQPREKSVAVLGH